MTWFGTDIVALGCILGGAALGGTVTAATMVGGHHADAGCGVEAIAVSPRIAISHGGEARAIVVNPNVRVHAVRDCIREVEGVVEIHMDNHLEHLDAQLEHLDRALEIELRQLEHQIEAEVEQGMEARFEFQEAMREAEAARLKVVMEKLGGAGI